MKRLLAALCAGALFGIGLAVSRMTDPNVVLAFLDPLGAFDPRLAAVMAGAITTTVVAFRWVLRRPHPLLDADFRLPAVRAVDRRLLAGAAIFGIGWGLAGYCPGPVLVGAAAGVHSALIFLAAMLAGSALHAGWERMRH